MTPRVVPFSWRRPARRAHARRPPAPALCFWASTSAKSRRASPWANSRTTASCRSSLTHAERHLGDPLQPVPGAVRQARLHAAGRGRRDRRVRRPSRRTGPRRPARGDRPGGGCRLAVPGRTAQRRPRRRRRLLGAHPRRAGPRHLRGQRALLGRHRRDGRRAVHAARALVGRGRGAGGGEPRRGHRHEPLRCVRQERAHPLCQPG